MICAYGARGFTDNGSSMPRVQAAPKNGKSRSIAFFMIDVVVAEDPLN
jgi:hypothetical protein